MSMLISSSISKRVRVDVPIVGDVREVLVELLAQMKTATQRPSPADLAPWWAQIEGWRARNCLAYEHSDQVIKPQFVLERCTD